MWIFSFFGGTAVPGRGVVRSESEYVSIKGFSTSQRTYTADLFATGIAAGSESFYGSILAGNETITYANGSQASEGILLGDVNTPVNGAGAYGTHSENGVFYYINLPGNIFVGIGGSIDLSGLGSLVRVPSRQSNFYPGTLPVFCPAP